MSNNTLDNLTPVLLNTAYPEAINGVVFPGVLVAGTSPPSDTRYLYYNTTDNTPYYYSPVTSTWVEFTGSTAATPLYVMLTANFTAGAIGATGLVISVSTVAYYTVGMFFTVLDNTLTSCVYQCTSIDTDTSQLTLTRVDQNEVSSTYVFSTTNGAYITQGGSGSSSGSSSGGGSTLTVEPYSITILDIPALSWATSPIYIANFGDISSILTSDNCLVRCYVNEVCMLADANRAIGTAPLPSSGILSGDIYCGANVLVPLSFGCYVSENLYLNVYNYQSFTESINLTFTSSNA